MSGNLVARRLLARNTAVNVVGQALPVLVAAAALPLLARGLGTDRLGLLSLGWTVITLFGDFGFGRAATKLAADSLGRGEVERLPGVTWGTALLQFAIGVGVGLAFALAVPVLTARVLHLPPQLEREARAGFYCLAAGLPIVLLATAFRGVLEAAQKFVSINAVRVPVSTATFFLPLLALPLHWGFAGIMVLLLSARLGSLVAYFALAVRAFPALLRPTGIREEFPRVLHFGAWATVSTVVSPLLVYLDRFILSAVAGLAALAFYTPSMELAMRLLVIPGSMTMTLFPAFSTLHARADQARLDRLAAQVSRYVLLLLGPILVVIAAGAHDLLRLWLGPQFERNGALALQILTFGVAVNALGHVFFALVQGVGRPDLTAKFHAVQLPFYALGAWLLIRAWGVPGAALAWSLRAAADALLLYGCALRASVVSRTAMAAEKVGRTMVLLVGSGMAAAMAAALPASLTARMSVIGLILLLVAAMLWYWALAADERRWLARAMKS